jgi:uncharacterized OB-fold protein
MAKTRVPAIEGWMRLDADEPCLLGTRCAACGCVFFPRESFFCRNPACSGTDLEEVPLSRRGRLWSYTNSCYPPPEPYVAAVPFEPYALAAVELEDEKMVVLGQVVSGVGTDELETGMEMEITLEPLFEDDDNRYLIWKWKPVG